MEHNPAATNSIVALEALFAGVEVALGDRKYHLGADTDGEQCVCIHALIDDFDDDGNEIEALCLMEVDFDLGDFIRECARMEEDYVIDLAHRTALVKVSGTLAKE